MSIDRARLAEVTSFATSNDQAGCYSFMWPIEGNLADWYCFEPIVDFLQIDHAQ